MTSIVSRSELIRRAIRWISEERVAHPGRALGPIVDEAAFRFDMNPIEQGWLRYTFLHEEGPLPPPPGRAEPSES